MTQEVTIVDETTTKEGKIWALVAHFPVLGTLIAWIVNLNKKNDYTAFYVRQMIGYSLLSFLIEVIVGAISGTIAGILGIALFVLWVISLIGAFTNELKLMPVVGAYFQKVFRSL